MQVKQPDLTFGLLARGFLVSLRSPSEDDRLSESEEVDCSVARRFDMERFAMLLLEGSRSVFVRQVGNLTREVLLRQGRLTNTRMEIEE